MTRAATLIIDFKGFWLTGTGGAQGRKADVVLHRDRWGCPALPMTAVKGLLRETAQRLARAGAANWDKDKLGRMFGDQARERALEAGQVERYGKEDRERPGALAFEGEARLPKEARAWFAGADRAAARQRLSCLISSTAIDERGAAKDKTLRAIEAAVPLTLSGTVSWIGVGPPEDGWVELIDAACAATLAFGKLKGVGFGRAIARLEAAP